MEPPKRVEDGFYRQLGGDRARQNSKYTTGLIYETGLERVPAINTNQYVPGALADHLTSFGGDLLAGSQMSILDWIRAGATASYGTVTEPTANRSNSPKRRSW